MLNFAKVMIPTDFSTNANQALRHGAAIAHRFNSEIFLLHIVTRFDDEAEDAHRFSDLDAFYHRVESEAMSRMAGLADNVEKTSVQMATVRGFAPADEIIKFANANGVELIVMGTHGRSALAHFLVGSVAEKVVRHASCPVMSVAHQEKQLLDPPFIESILVPIDFSPFSMEVVPFAVEMAQRFDASLNFLHVIDQRLYPEFYVVGEGAVAKTIPDMYEKSMLKLKDMIDDSITDIRDFECFVREGVPHTEITSFCRIHECDLIMMATHGLTGLEKLVIGSTAEKVVRKAECPVLTFKPENYRNDAD